MLSADPTHAARAGLSDACGKGKAAAQEEHDAPTECPEPLPSSSEAGRCRADVRDGRTNSRTAIAIATVES